MSFYLSILRFGLFEQTFGFLKWVREIKEEMEWTQRKGMVRKQGEEEKYKGERKTE